MDDGPRTGGLQMLCLIIGGTALYVALSSGALVALPFAVVFLGLVGWLEGYARRRTREDQAAEEARRRRASISHLDF
jgi:UDP-N-acetylmuramyl pentapeptide phosphotransferase/UDP-N-acetylglucosamine-1-phosphate transferase